MVIVRSQALTASTLEETQSFEGSDSMFVIGLTRTFSGIRRCHMDSQSGRSKPAVHSMAPPSIIRQQFRQDGHPSTTKGGYSGLLLHNGHWPNRSLHTGRSAKKSSTAGGRLLSSVSGLRSTRNARSLPDIRLGSLIVRNVVSISRIAATSINQEPSLVNDGNVDVKSLTTSAVTSS